MEITKEDIFQFINKGTDVEYLGIHIGMILKEYGKTHTYQHPQVKDILKQIDAILWQLEEQEDIYAINGYWYARNLRYHWELFCYHEL